MVEKYGCSKVFFDKEKKEKKRLQWSELTKDIEEGDTLVILSLDNILTTVTNLPFLFRWIILKKIRLVSISDEIDTEGKYFEPKGSKEIFDIIGKLPKKIGENKRKGYSYKISSFIPGDSKENSKKSLVIKVVNMYHSGYSVAEIANAVGYKTRKSVYNVLDRFAIEKRQLRRTQRKEAVKAEKEQNKDII